MDGLFSHLLESNEEKRSVCFEFSYLTTVSMDYVAYSISILETTKLESIYNYYPPQIIGQFYRRMIPKGGYAVYHSLRVEPSDKKLTFNSYNRKGVAEMYIKNCQTYPNCTYTTESNQSLQKPKRINRMSIWDLDIDRTYDALDSEKYVMIIYCKDDNNENEGYCEVDTSFELIGKTIELVENEQFSKYALKDENGIFRMDLKGATKIERLTIDIMIYSGDVIFDVEEFDDTSYEKYFLSNKIVYNFNLAQTSLDELKLEYKAEVNSFFTIKYEINFFNPTQLREIILSGENYLVQLDPYSSGQTKSIFLQNYRIKEEKPFLVNFFALKCDLQVSRNNQKISFFEGYAQEILLSNTEGYNSEMYEYTIKITEKDKSNYDGNMCMVYVMGYESSDSKYQTEIVVSDNVNRKVIFNNEFKSIRFLYPLVDTEKDLSIFVNILDKAYYYLKIYFNNEDIPFKEYNITRSQVYFLSGSEIINHCSINKLCNLIVETSFIKYIDNENSTEEAKIELTIRQIKNTPSYLQHNRNRKDFIYGNMYYYFYTDIGKNDLGEITVDFPRNVGKVWGRIVRKDQIIKDEEAVWRGIYRLPSEEDTLEYNGYIKKYKVSNIDTQDCIVGCYLLLSIQVSQIGDYVEDYKFYPFSIITRISQTSMAYTEIPKVIIQVNEFIVGNADVAKNERISHFYEVWLTHDSYRVDFDFQSEVAGLYISLGGTRPTTKNADFILLPSGKDSILSIDKFSIIQKAEAKKINIPYKNSLQDINLVIGVWTDKTDSIDTEVYSLSVRLPSDDEILDILEINTDQKILCSPRYLNDNIFRGLFIVTYDDQDEELDMPLLIHAASLNQSAITYFYANFIEREYYDEFDIDSLKGLIPTRENAQFNTEKECKEYIYTTLKHSESKKYYLFISVLTDKMDDLFILTSMPKYNIIDQNYFELYPNSIKEQLLSVSEGKKLNLKFFIESGIIVNIITLGGEAAIKWAHDPNNIYKLRGNGDRLTLTAGNNFDEIIIENTKELNTILNYPNDPGFVFYISYYKRNPEFNFDKVIYGKSVEVDYKQANLPIYLYSKIGSCYHDINIAITFKDLDLNKNGEYESSHLSISAGLFSEDTIYEVKNDLNLKPSIEDLVIGKYDPALKTGQIIISRFMIDKYNISSKDNPTLYIYIDNNFMNQNYIKFSIETQITKINSNVFPVENIYNYGR